MSAARIAPIFCRPPATPMTYLESGMRAEVVPEVPVDGPRTARVKVVDRVADAASGTFGVRLEHPNPGHKLPAGLKCKIRFPR